MLFKRWGHSPEAGKPVAQKKSCFVWIPALSALPQNNLYSCVEFDIILYHPFMTSQLNFNIIYQNKRPVYVIKLYIVLLQPLAFCFQRSQNESTGSFILSQEEVPSNGFFQVQTFHNLRNVSSRPGKHKIDANLHLTCTSHQKSIRFYLLIWPTSYVLKTISANLVKLKAYIYLGEINRRDLLLGGSMLTLWSCSQTRRT